MSHSKDDNYPDYCSFARVGFVPWSKALDLCTLCDSFAHRASLSIFTGFHKKGCQSLTPESMCQEKPGFEDLLRKRAAKQRCHCQNGVEMKPGVFSSCGKHQCESRWLATPKLVWWVMFCFIYSMFIFTKFDWFLKKCLRKENGSYG